MKFNPFSSLSTEDKCSRNYFPSTDTRFSNRYNNPKIYTQQSVPKKNTLNFTFKNSQQITYKSFTPLSQSSKTQSLNLPFSQSRQFLSGNDTLNDLCPKNNEFDSIPIYFGGNAQMTRVTEILNKKSMQSLLGMKKSMYKTHYSKINRKKQEFNKKNQVDRPEKQEQKQQQQQEEFSEQKLIQKYRELMQNSDKSKPLNLINQLYKIDAFFTKQVPLATKEEYKSLNAKLSISSSKNNSIQSKVNRIFSKQPQTGKIREILISSSDKAINNIKGVSKGSNESGYSTIKVNVQQTTDKIGTDLKMRTKQLNLGKLGTQLQKLRQANYIKYRDEERNSLIRKTQSSNTIQTNEKSTMSIVPFPKKLYSSAFIIYQIIETSKNKSPLKRASFQVEVQQRRKEYSGRIHTSSNLKATAQIASLTKIMTCIAVIDICQKLSINPNQQKYKTGLFQSCIRGTTAQLEPGQIYTIDQLLHGLMLPSGNDASLALARWAGNVLLNTDYQTDKKKTNECSKQLPQNWSINNKYLRFKEERLKPRRCYNRFIAEMNKKARTLGLERTSYVNSHGLSNILNKSCCIDIAILCEYAMKNSYFRKIVNCKTYTAIIDKQNQSNTPLKFEQSKNKSKRLNEDPQTMNLEQEIYGGQQQWSKSEASDYQQMAEMIQNRVYVTKKQITWINTHKLLHSKQEYIGIKTGVTATAGACLASYLQLADRNFIIVVLNSKKLAHRFSDTQTLRLWLMKKQKMTRKQLQIQGINHQQMLQR